MSDIMKADPRYPFDKDIYDLFNRANKQEQEAFDFIVGIEEPTPENLKRTAVIRTSDRIAFKACRRKWAFSSHLRGNLEPKQSPSPLWFGIGIHFVLEDYHGYRRFEDPVDAFNAFVEATRNYKPGSLPDDYLDLWDMGKAMIRYYQKWEKRRESSLLKTYFVDGVPQVEVNFRVKIPMPQETLDAYGFDEVVYSGTIDRVVIDELTGFLWLLDHKTAKVFNSFHFQMDPQISSYCWAGTQMYDKPIGGMIYSQHLKRLIKPIQPLKSGRLSIAANQVTTSIMYKEGLETLYGSVEKATDREQEYLINLMKSEDERQDRFIRQDFIPRSHYMLEAEGTKIMMETVDMLNPDIPLYPSPGMQCGIMCSFNGACVSLDDGSDWEGLLAAEYVKRATMYDGWRECLVYPGEKEDRYEYINDLYSE